MPNATSRVLVLSAHHGHIDRRILSQANILVESELDVTLLSVPAEFDHHFLDSRVRIDMATGGDGPQGDRLLRWGRSAVGRFIPDRVQVAVRRASLRVGGANSLGWTDWFASAAKGSPYEIIHCHDLPTLPAAIQIAGAMEREPSIIYDSHELYPWTLRDAGFTRHWRCIEAGLISSVDRVITVNPALASRMAAEYDIRVPDVIYNSCPANDAPAVSSDEFLDHFGALGIVPSHAMRLIFQGGASSPRNLATLIAAFEHLDPHHCLFMLVQGDGLKSLQRLSQRRGLGNRVFFGPWVPQSQLVPFLRGATAGVIPYSGAESENLRLCTPNKLFEFMEAERPVLANDLPELRRIINDCGIGIVTEIGNPHAMAAAIRSLEVLDGQHLAAGFERARLTYGWDRQVERLMRIYTEILTGHR